MMRLTPALLLLIAAAASAQPGAGEVAPPPAMGATEDQAAEAQPPAPESSDEVTEPKVTILQRGEDVVEEHRVGGRLYMVKITPRNGYPYFLIDTDGDGSLETRRSEFSNPPIPQWVLFRW